MCGIFLCKTKNENAEKLVLQGLKNLEYRGYDSWGICSFSLKEFDLQRFVGKVSETKFHPKESGLSFGHTRWATHGKVSLENCHPHVSNSGRYVIVHNGIFENYLEHKSNLEKNYFKFSSQTDTEVLVNVIEKFGTENIFQRVKGGNAFIVIDKVTEEVIIGKNGSPLYIGKNTDDVYVSSDMNALLKDSAEIYSLKDGEILNLDDLDKIKFTFVTEGILSDKEKICENELGDFTHYTLKEIFDQKQTIRNAYDKNINLSNYLKKDWYKNKIIFASGCGTAYHAALFFAQFANIKGINVKSLPANENEQVSNLINKKTILFLFSQSGETADSIIFAKKVLKSGGKVISILNNQYSTLKQISTHVFLIHSGKEVAVASTKAFTGMVSTTLKLLGLKIRKQDFEKLEKYINFELVEKVKGVVANFEETQNAFVIGKGYENVSALETALKIKETSYIHAEGMASGELKHGVLALIEEKVLSVVMSCQKEYESEMENAALQINTRGGTVIGIGIKNQNSYKYFIEVPDFQLSYLAGVIVGQILAFEFSIQRGNNPDKPRNLAKSVTVK